MRAQIAQLAALVMHGNARLDYGHDPAGLVGHSTTDLCDSITFCDATDRTMPLTAESVGDWLDSHDASHTLYLQLHHHPASRLMVGDRMLEGFVNTGGRWLIEQCHGFRSDLWESNWEPAGERWLVEYGRIQAAMPALPIDTEPLEPLGDRLLEVVRRLQELAADNDLPDFADRFEQAVQCLEDPDPPEPPTYPDLAPIGLLSVEARQLLSAIDAAWVFAAEDSWNDAAITKRVTEYEPLSDELYRLLTRGLCAVTNSTAVPLRAGDGERFPFERARLLKRHAKRRLDSLIIRNRTCLPPSANRRRSTCALRHRPRRGANRGGRTRRGRARSGCRAGRMRGRPARPGRCP
ncbi:MAG: hypothetical protein QM770_03095 [Tepidisphaeraceae bacterium]